MSVPFEVDELKLKDPVFDEFDADEFVPPRVVDVDKLTPPEKPDLVPELMALSLPDCVLEALPPLPGFELEVPLPEEKPRLVLAPEPGFVSVVTSALVVEPDVVVAEPAVVLAVVL